MAEGFVPFQSTLWTVIHGAGRGDRASFDDFVRSYRRPLASFLQGRGISDPDAEDLVQDVFLRIFEKGLLERLNAEKGRFRSFLLAVARNVAGEFQRQGSAGKRGGGRPRVSLDEVSISAGGEPDEEFDRLWIQNLVQVAFERLKQSPSGNGEPYYELLKAYTEGDSSYESLGARVGMTVTQVRTSLETARKRLRKFVLEILSEYVLSPEELEEERRFVAKYLT